MPDFDIRSLVISVILQDRSTTMTIFPHSYSTPVLGHQKHDKTQSDKIDCMVSDMYCPGRNIIIITTATTNNYECVLAIPLCVAPENI